MRQRSPRSDESTSRRHRRPFGRPCGLRSGRRARHPALSREGPEGAASVGRSGRGRPPRRRPPRGRPRRRRDPVARDGRRGGARRRHPDRAGGGASRRRPRAPRRHLRPLALGAPTSASRRFRSRPMSSWSGRARLRTGSATRRRPGTRAALSRVTPRTSTFAHAPAVRAGRDGSRRAGGSPRPSTTARARGRSFPPMSSIVTLADPPLNVTGMVTVILDPEGWLREFVAVPPQVPPPATEPPAHAHVGRALRGSRASTRRPLQARIPPGCRACLSTRSLDGPARCPEKRT